MDYDKLNMLNYKELLVLDPKIPNSYLTLVKDKKATFNWMLTLTDIYNYDWDVIKEQGKDLLIYSRLITGLIYVLRHDPNKIDRLDACCFKYFIAKLDCVKTESLGFKLREFILGFAIRRSFSSYKLLEEYLKSIEELRQDINYLRNEIDLYLHDNEQEKESLIDHIKSVNTSYI